MSFSTNDAESCCAPNATIPAAKLYVHFFQRSPFAARSSPWFLSRFFFAWSLCAFAPPTSARSFHRCRDMKPPCASPRCPYSIVLHGPQTWHDILVLLCFFFFVFHCRAPLSPRLVPQMRFSRAISVFCFSHHLTALMAGLPVRDCRPR